MRQRLSSEPDRYRGRRRVPTPPRSRYAVVVTSAFIGAGVVAIGAASNLPNAKDVNPEVLQGLKSAQVADQAISDRSNGDRASRSEDRSVDKTNVSADESTADVWLLPLDSYTYSSPFGIRWGQLHAGIDLAAPEGMPYKAVHSGKVIQAGYYGGYGIAVTVQNDDGTQVIYAHSRRAYVKVGDEVKAGQTLGQVGNTGNSFGTHLHLEIHVKGQPVDPIPFLRERGVDIKLQVESIYAGMAAAAS